MATAETELIPNYGTYRTVVGVLDPLVHSFGGYEAHNLEVLREVENQPVIFAPNHRANIDSVVFGLTLFNLHRLTQEWDKPLESRPIHYMAKDTLWRYPGMRQLVIACGGFRVARNQGVGLRQDQVDHIEHLVDNDAALGIFPEGTRLPKDRDAVHQDKLKTTVGFLALKHGIDVVPVGLAGPRSLTKLPMHVVFGKPLRVDRRDDIGSSEFNHAKYAFMDDLHLGMDEAYQSAKSYLD